MFKEFKDKKEEKKFDKFEVTLKNGSKVTVCGFDAEQAMRLQGIKKDQVATVLTVFVPSEKDLKITCKCTKVFYVTEGEQAFYKEKGFETPKLCKACRDVKKQKNKEMALKKEKGA